MKLRLLTIGCLFFCFVTKAQQTSEEKYRQWFEKTRKEVRSTGDPFLQRGDTIYLLYDSTDSLQVMMPSSIEWWLRPMTEQDEQEAIEAQNMDHYYFLVKEWTRLYEKKKTILLTPDQVKKMTLTTRKELMDFYEREFNRGVEKAKKDKKIKPYAIGNWPLMCYFDRIYMLMPRDDGMYVMFRVL